MTSFDPYYKWLGIRDPERPPNHYRLLGVEMFESNIDVITTAADRQMAHLRTYRHGQNVDTSEQLLNEVSTARVCLLDPDKKARYDQQLRNSQAPDAPPIRPPESPESDPDVIVDPNEAGWKSSGRHRRSMSRHVPTIVLVTSLITLAVIAFVRYGPLSNDEAAVTTMPAEVIAKDGNHDVDDPDVPDEARPEPTVEPETPRENPAPDPVSENPRVEVPEPVQRAAPWAAENRRKTGDPPRFSGADPDGAVLLAISRRRFDDARGMLDVLEQEEPLDNRRRVDRLRLLLYSIERFWQAYQEARDALSPGDTLLYNGQPTLVVSVLANQLELEALNGERETFELSEATIERDLLLALVESSAKDAPAVAWRMIGFFLAVDRLGDARMAQEYLSRAGQHGFQGEYLVQVIDELAAHAPGRIVSVPTQDGPTRRPSTDGRLPIPTNAQLIEAKRELKANGLLDRVAANCIEAAREHEDVAKYALLSEAARKSVATGDLATGLLAIDELDEHFAIDVWHVRFDLLRSMTRSDSVARRQLADGALALARQAVLSDEYEPAERFAKMAVSIANPLRDNLYTKQLVQRRQRIKQIQRLYKQSRDAARLIETRPDDPAANLTMGHFLCFAKGNFVDGLRHLRNGTDEQLRKLAAKDLANPRDPQERLDVANGWLQRSAQLEGLEKLHALERARHWFEATLRQRNNSQADDVRQKLNQIAATIGRIERFVDVTRLHPARTSVGYGRFGVNQNPDLRNTTIRELPQVGGVAISQYLWAHAPSKVEYLVPPGAKRFSALGLLNADSGDGVRFQVHVDGNQVSNTQVLKSAGQQVSILVQLPPRAQRIVLTVDSVKSYSNDQTYWVNPVFTF